MKKQERTVSIVVPCRHGLIELQSLVLSITCGLRKPDELIIVFSSLSISGPAVSSNVQRQLFDLTSCHGIDLRLVETKQAFPGKARNIGMDIATGDLIAFLDIKTLPDRDWLKVRYEILVTEDIHGVWGSTKYWSNSWLSSAVLDVIYGAKPHQTLPGTVMKRECLPTLGKMISWTPAGEDKDWIQRINSHKLRFKTINSGILLYTGLAEKSFSYFVRKWWIYYHFSRTLSVNDRDRWISYFLIYATTGFVAFNWNFKISEFIFGTSIVVPHVTKIVLIMGPVLYIFFRSIYLPIKRRVELRRIFPFRFLLLVLVSLILDSTKLLALLTPLRSKTINKQNDIF